MQLGQVKLPEDSDFLKVKTMCLSVDGWRHEYSKPGIALWKKSNEESDFDMVKIICSFSDVSATVLYDVLHDAKYRKAWDPNVLDCFEICRVACNSDIGYYSMKLVPPLMNRDFVTQRCWVNLGKEKIIFNHSVNHASAPVKKNFVRAISYLTGYYIVSTAHSPDGPGCQLTYVTHSNPQGRLPAWSVNFATTLVAPKVMKNLHKACCGYLSWKSMNAPDWKPWLSPDQNSLLEAYDPKDLKSMDETTGADIIDERSMKQEKEEDGNE